MSVASIFDGGVYIKDGNDTNRSPGSFWKQTAKHVPTERKREKGIIPLRRDRRYTIRNKIIKKKKLLEQFDELEYSF